MVIILLIFIIGQVFESVSPFITSCVDGYNVCIFAYGQTGSGKKIILYIDFIM
jgi:hypothetical protein